MHGLIAMLFVTATQSTAPATIAVANASGFEKALTTIFKSACYDGQVRLSHQESVPLAPNTMPRVLRDWFNGTTLVAYRLKASPNSYLINFTGDGRGDRYKSGCAIATKDALASTMWTSVTDLILPRGSKTQANIANVRKLEWSMPQEGYTTTVHAVSGGYTIVQLSMLNDAQIKSRLKEDARLQKIAARKRSSR